MKRSNMGKITGGLLMSTILLTGSIAYASDTATSPMPFHGQRQFQGQDQGQRPGQMQGQDQRQGQMQGQDQRQGQRPQFPDQAGMRQGGPLAKLVSDGVITQEQADAIMSKFPKPGDGTREPVQMEGILSALVTDGTITQTQADAILALKPPAPPEQRHENYFGQLISDGVITQAQVDALMSKFPKPGEKTPGPINIDEMLGSLVADGTLTQEQADAIRQITPNHNGAVGRGPNPMGRKAPKVTMKLGSPLVTLGEGDQTETTTLDVAPTAPNGYTLIPVRGLFDKIGGTLEWNGDTRQVTIKQGDNVIVLTLDSKEALVNGQPVAMQDAAQIINGRTLIPLRFISECLGYKVQWQPEESKIIIDSES
ncbi:stalk domain-containing protein [Heliophilum fasciatum]|uniref:Copper amine oxidase-like protein n=1 Tax=Heliophilum fasciatum TaxID=35700 RepID=A0A4R2RNR9_9FIRM|nr:stalk domain-containing protein [Heliophilum fasciatum]MCW2278222.1 competence protein ComGC [Heliophilum fasciatum]TCP63957.1 copper amine oxidase-like protein [Heliophilum fasciatum]